MSTLSIQLAGGRASPSRVARWRPVFSTITERLFKSYGEPDLGNLRDVAREILYIALSAKTTEKLYQRAYRRLIARFKNVSAMATASIADIAECISCAGFGNKRANQIREIANRLTTDFGTSASRRLASMSPLQAFEYLTRLPGIGRKSAFCIMMMSLDADVFPVDVNVHRIAHRIGALRAGLKHFQAQENLPALIADGESRRLHIGLVLHGRRICLPRQPLCQQCVLLDICKYGQRKTRKIERETSEAA